MLRDVLADEGEAVVGDVAHEGELEPAAERAEETGLHFGLGKASGRFARDAEEAVAAARGGPAVGGVGGEDDVVGGVAAPLHRNRGDGVAVQRDCALHGEPHLRGQAR